MFSPPLLLATPLTDKQNLPLAEELFSADNLIVGFQEVLFTLVIRYLQAVTDVGPI